MTPHLDRYEILRRLGGGGMGEVYLARDRQLNRLVAIKFIVAQRAGDEDARRRLIREAQAAAGLDHPNICTVFEAAEAADGQLYIVMQFVDGEPLSAILKRGPMPVGDALALCGEIAAALDAAHQRGVVHRDLKPANVILAANGQPKLVDFGIAKVVVTDPHGDAETKSGLTRSGAIIGTPPYMSPEQIQQRPVDGRSDLFSLGAVLFECLTGRQAFHGATPTEAAANVLHVHPAPPSHLCSELSEGHDELCRRLLAKNPAERFQSAKEVLGAIRVLVTQTARTSPPPAPRRATVIEVLRRRPARFAVALVAAIAAIAAIGWVAPAVFPLERVPQDSELAYRRGVEALQEGAYYTASRSLEQAVELFPRHVFAYARLAEAYTELDDQQRAQDSLLRVSIPWYRPRHERLRIDAIRSLVMRNLDAAIAAYRDLAHLNPNDAGSWVDLGRAQEAAGLTADARGSYERAVATDRRYAPAHLRLGSVEAHLFKKDEALAAFAEAERLYEASVDVEGRIEVLLRRGSALDGAGELKLARRDLERALALASEIRSTSQHVRARLSLSSVTASEAQFEEAERSASAAVQDALTNGLHTVAATGLIDLAATLLQMGRNVEAQAAAERAIQLADKHSARRTAARGRVQLAAIHAHGGRPKEALDLVNEVLPFLEQNRYRRFELTALSVAARAHTSLDELENARRMASNVLAVSETVKDQAQIAIAATTLALVATRLGHYPEALRLRTRTEDIHRQLGDASEVPYHLTNRADLLVRMGRVRDAELVLSELEKHIAAGDPPYVNRARHAAYLRGFAAVTALDCRAAAPFLQRPELRAPASDTPGVMAGALRTFCDSVTRKVPPAPTERAEMDPSLARERAYWLAAASVHRRDWQRAVAEATRGLELLGDTSNDELRWRLAAVGAIAAQHLSKPAIVARLVDAARTSLQRLEAEWREDFASYRRRADLADLSIRAGL